MFNMAPVTPEEQESLEAICQTNDWVKRGGYPCQDDPYMEEYPYEFDRCFSMEDLQDFFKQGNWGIRQGVVYGDLAFIQQVNGGDEWWTLKKDGDGWVPFESISFGHIAGDISELTRHIACMRIATVDECKHLDYLPPESDMQWVGNAFPYIDDGWVAARNCDFRIHIEQNHMGKLLTVNAPTEEYMIDQSEEGKTLLQIISSQIEAANRYKEERLMPRLADRTQDAMRASENQRRAERPNEAREAVRQQEEPRRR